VIRQLLADTRPLRDHAAFRRLWLGSTASGFGSNLGAFAVTYYVWERTHNVAVVGLIGLATAAPDRTLGACAQAWSPPPPQAQRLSSSVE